jgi:hypothetical protein
VKDEIEGRCWQNLEMIHLENMAFQLLQHFDAEPIIEKRNHILK